MWMARNLQEVLGYTEWRNFEAVIEKARESCGSGGVDERKHFVEVDNMVSIGSGAQRGREVRHFGWRDDCLGARRSSAEEPSRAQGEVMLTEKQAWLKLSKRVNVRGLCDLVADLKDRREIERETADAMYEKIDMFGPPLGRGRWGLQRWPLSKKGMEQRRAFCSLRARELP
jgi:hypothetical protein